MSDGKRSNGNDSDTRYRNAQNKYDNLTEAEFLAHEADLAKTAMSTAFGGRTIIRGLRWAWRPRAVLRLRGSCVVAASRRIMEPLPIGIASGYFGRKQKLR
jgi:hypothetical protein